MTIICPNCGHQCEVPSPEVQARARWEPLSSGLVRILIKAVIAVHRKNENNFHWHRDLALTNNESHNLQKLRYHALIAHADPDHPKSGEWLITGRGGQFLRGEIVVPRRVLVQANHVIDHDKTNPVHIDALKNKYPEFDSKFAYVPCLMPQKVETPELFVRT